MTNNWLPVPKIYSQKYPNQSLLLYHGFAELIDNNTIIEGKGLVTLVWYPSPHINFKFTYFSEEDTHFSAQVKLKLTELVPQQRLEIHISLSRWWGKNNKRQFSGYLVSPFFKGITDNLSSITFYIPNFWFFNISNQHEWDGKNNLIEQTTWLDWDG